MFAVFWTLNHGNNDLQDFFVIDDTAAEAEARYTRIVNTQESVHCAGWGPIQGATEPHWVEGQDV